MHRAAATFGLELDRVACLFSPQPSAAVASRRAAALSPWGPVLPAVSTLQRTPPPCSSLKRDARAACVRLQSMGIVSAERQGRLQNAREGRGGIPPCQAKQSCSPRGRCLSVHFRLHLFFWGLRIVHVVVVMPDLVCSIPILSSWSTCACLRPSLPPSCRFRFPLSPPPILLPASVPISPFVLSLLSARLLLLALGWRAGETDGGTGLD